MPHAPEAALLAFSDIDGAVEHLRAHGLRVSASRRLVLEALFAAGRPVSAEEIAGGLGGRLPRADVASVYRNLQVFQELGLVRHLHLPHGPGLYAVAGGEEREFLVCERCGDVRAVDPRRLDAVRAAVQDGFGYRVRFVHFPIVGVCADCAAAEEPGGHRDHEHAHSHPHRHGDLLHAHPHTSHVHEH